MPSHSTTTYFIRILLKAYAACESRRRLKLHLFEVFNAGLKDLHILIKGYVLV